MADKPQTSKASRAAVSRTRRSGIRKVVARKPRSWREAVRQPAHTWGLVIALLFAVSCGSLAAWTRERALVAPGRVMTETRVVRTAFSLEDVASTEAERESARRRAPRVYVADRVVLEGVQNTLERLPTALADVATVADVAPEIREQFSLSAAELDALRAHTHEGEADESWRERVAALLSRLRAAPLLDSETYQLEQQHPNDWVELRTWSGEPARALKSAAVNIAGGQTEQWVRNMVRSAGFNEPLQSMIASWLVRTIRPTFTYDEEATERLRDDAAAAVAPKMITYPEGRVLYRRGDVLDDEAYAVYRAEQRAHLTSAPRSEIWVPRLGALAGGALATAALAAYLVMFCPRIIRNPMRVAAIAGLMLATMVIACWGVTAQPWLIALAATAPTVFVAVIMVIAYDQRTALALAAVHALMVAMALARPSGELLVALAGVGVAVWQLREIRQRNALIRAGVYTAVSLALATAVTAALRRPLAPGLWIEVVGDAGWAASGGLMVGFLTLGILPTVERVFGITTGMTLIELRDPKQPLLRELQQRAPGTYNHSLTVATLAESAADAIGAHGLHVYVGALYHDIGKMNKPDYFVENQTPGFNRHSKLSPAMSLLVIVGHVKDGAELAREYNLPRSLHHYIESHHGTTLVEYFYRQAWRRAEEEEGAAGPEEIEYRYPGPKPRTKEAAILMLCDAVESATRAMPDPTPSRIESLVHSLATRRLMDGQFDECELTLRELNTIEESVIKTLNSIYHARIAYPEGPSTKDERRQAAEARAEDAQAAREASERSAAEQSA